MGGVSKGFFEMNETLEFYGTLSLENHGGFASVRSYREPIEGVTDDSTFIVKVKGDGRPYEFNLHNGDDRSENVLFKSSFSTVRDEWVELEFPVQNFVASIMGQEIPWIKLDVNDIGGIGFLIADGKEGDFNIEVESVTLYSLT